MSFGSILNRMVSKISASQIEGTLAQDQIPNLDTSKITSGVLPVERGGTGVNSLDSLKQELGSSINTTVFSLEMGQGHRTIVPSGTSIKPFFGVIVELEVQDPNLNANIVLSCHEHGSVVIGNTYSGSDFGKFIVFLPVQQWGAFETNNVRTAYINDSLSFYFQNYQNEMWTLIYDIELQYSIGGGSPSYSCTLTFLHWGN